MCSCIVLSKVVSRQFFSHAYGAITCDLPPHATHCVIFFAFRASSPESETEAGPQVTLPAGTVFYCNFHAPSLDCPIKEEPYGSFQVRRLVGGGGYLTTTVGQNESAAVTLDRVLAVPDNDTEASACLRFRFRKGPFRDGAGGSSQLHVRLSVLDRNVIKSSTLTRHYSHWTPYSITIARPIQVQLTLLLKVGANSAPQYFDLTDVLLASKPC